MGVGRHYVMGGGLKVMISSYSNSFSCSRLMSSLCTVENRIRSEGGKQDDGRRNH